MLLASSMLISGFIFWAAFMTDDINDDDDDDDFRGGKLIPIYNTTTKN
jgi:hypothetical protein